MKTLLCTHTPKSFHINSSFFQAPKDEFAIRDLKFTEFKAYYRGKRVNNNETLDVSQITSIGIQMYGGVYQPVKQKGPAALEIDWIRAVV